MANERVIKIKVAIMRKNLTGSKIAKKLGVTREYVNATIRGKWKTIWLRKEIAKILDVSYEYLWDEPEPKDDKKAA